MKILVEDMIAGSVLEGVYNPIKNPAKLYEKPRNPSREKTKKTLKRWDNAIRVGALFVKLWEIFNQNDKIPNRTTSLSEIKELSEYASKEDVVKELQMKLQAQDADLKTLFNQYKKNHENILKKAKDAVQEINKYKVLMKEYLVTDLHEELKKYGLAGTLGSSTCEDLSIEDWPVKEDYSKVSNKFHIETTKLTKLIDFYCTAFSLPGMVINEYRISKLKNEIDEFDIVLENNIVDMKADNDRFAIYCLALYDISFIYKSIYEECRPKMKKMIIDLNRVYIDSFEQMSEGLRKQLYMMAHLLDELADISIVRRQDTNENYDEDMVQYKEDITRSFRNFQECLNNHVN